MDLSHHKDKNKSVTHKNHIKKCMNITIERLVSYLVVCENLDVASIQLDDVQVK